MKIALRQYALSVAIFAIVLGGVASVDERVRDRFSGMVHGDAALSPWGDRAADLGAALAGAVRTRSLEGAPLLIFATVGGVLFLFMFRT